MSTGSLESSAAAFMPANPAPRIRTRGRPECIDAGFHTAPPGAVGFALLLGAEAAMPWSSTQGYLLSLYRDAAKSTKGTAKLSALRRLELVAILEQKWVESAPAYDRIAKHGIVLKSRDRTQKRRRCCAAVGLRFPPANLRGCASLPAPRAHF